jgi:hypothetical protein
MVFMICTVGMWIYTVGMWNLHNEHVDFEHWLGQEEKTQKKYPLCLTRGLKILKKRQKRLYENHYDQKIA